MIGVASMLVGILFATGVYLLLSRNLQRLAIGFILLTNGVNLLVITAAGLPEVAGPPILRPGDEGVPVVDPLPQAFVLTAIVIGLGMAAFLLAMVALTYRQTGADEVPPEPHP